MLTPFPQRKPAPVRPLRLTARDEHVLSSLGSCRFLSVPQISALHFDSPAAAATRMRRLHEAGLVASVFVPVRPYDRRAFTIFGLSGRGARLIAEQTGGPLPRFVSEREKRSGLFLDHTLRRNDLRICLDLLDRQERGFQLLVWRQSPDGLRFSAVVRGRALSYTRVPLVPDGFFAVKRSGVVQAFFVETDMGTVSLARMAVRYRAYQLWWRRGGHLDLCGSAPLRILTLTTTERRLAALRQAAFRGSGNPRHGSGLFWFALLAAADIAEPAKLLGPAWTTAAAGGDTARSLFATP